MLALPALLQWPYTAILFTWTDFKTIFFPVIAFACATGPVHSVTRLIHACAWIWIHLLLCNVSNQARSEPEDSINRPWRPLPSGRISRPQAILLRWLLVVTCMAWSASYGADLVFVTLVLAITTLLYDELGLAAQPIGKNICCIFGYTSFEFGATKLVGSSRHLDVVSLSAITISGVLIFTTIQAQDFADVEGDIALGRVTFPIFAPEFSRSFTALVVLIWSAILGWYWDVGEGTQFFLVLLGGYVGWRVFTKRSTEDDKHSYVMYNLWLTIAHALPLHKRTGLLHL
ncbi:hypothetical protein ACEPAH_4009 [Sanghuangporus vaninii]